jgi:hypothetical protein
MSLVNVLFGVVGLLGLVLAMATVMTLAAQATARVVGVAGFRWFDERPARAAWWRWFLVRLASALSPVALSFALFWGSMLGGGVTEVDPSTRVEVLEGAARAAGMRDGDRILRIGGEPIADWDQLRAAVKRHGGVTTVEIDRDGATLTLPVTPRTGRIGVQPRTLKLRPGVAAVARRAITMPFAVVRSTFEELARLIRRADPPELTGPVGVVRETAKAGHESGSAHFFLLAVLAGYLWPFAAGLVLFDVVTGYVFRATHPEAATSALPGYRLDRLRQAALFASAGYATFLAAALLTKAGISIALLPLVWSMLAAAAGYPLLWSGGKELWGRPISALVLVAAVFVPCVLLFAVLALHQHLGRALRREGFQVTWLNAQPAAMKSEHERWPTHSPHNL